MTEQEFLSSADPHAMLVYLMNPSDNANPNHLYPPSDRKLQLFAVACCCAVSAKLGADAEQWVNFNSALAGSAANWARDCASDQKVPSASWRSALLRSIVGNPFRPWVMKGSEAEEEERWRGNVHFGPTKLFDPEWLQWNCGTIPALAQSMYDYRDFSMMPALHDALVEAGCTDRDVLEHCLGRGRCPRCLGSGKDHYVYDGKARPAKCLCCGEVGLSEFGPGYVPAGPKCERCYEEGWMKPHECPDCHGTGRLPAVFARGDWCLDLILNKS